MEALERIVAFIVLYLLQAPPIGLPALVIAGWLGGWAIFMFYKRMKAPLEERPSQRAFLIVSGLAAVGFVWPFIIAGPGRALYFMPVFLIVLLVSALYYFFLRFWILILSGVVVFGVAFYAWLTWSRLEEAPLNEPLMVVRFRGKETVEERPRLSLWVREPDSDATAEQETYYVYGDSWGLAADVVTFEEGVRWVGGKRFYRPVSLLGRDDNTGAVDTRPINEVTDTLWAELKKNPDKLPGVKTIDEFSRFEQPAIGQQFDIELDDDGVLIITHRQQSLDDLEGAPAESESDAETTPETTTAPETDSAESAPTP
jgi:hypothetical protein